MTSLKYLISHMHENLCKLKDPSTPIEDGAAKMYKITPLNLESGAR